MGKCGACNKGKAKRLCSEAVANNVDKRVDESLEGISTSGKGCRCYDVCTNPICGTPRNLGIMAPVIYDEIGVNVCATFTIPATTPPTYTDATSAEGKVIVANLSNSTVTKIPGRKNCYLITLSQIDVTFALDMYNERCEYLGTTYVQTRYLPERGTETYDEDTNPSSIELEIFAPYGPAYSYIDGVYRPIINSTTLQNSTNGDQIPQGSNTLQQGINLYAYAKVLNVNMAENRVTVGVTFVVQSMYFSGYYVPAIGRVHTPKGSTAPSTDTDCMQFVEGKLLNLAIKPLNLNPPYCESNLKNDCTPSCVNRCTSSNYSCDCQKLRSNSNLALEATSGENIDSDTGEKFESTVEDSLF